MNLAGFDRPKVCKKKILCLYSPSLKVHSIKTSGPLRFSELGKHCASKNSVYLMWEACSKIDVYRVQSLEEKLEDLDSLSLNYWLRGTQRQFSENICSEDDLRSRIFGTFVVKFLA